jgi:hypothetical protein
MTSSAADRPISPLRAVATGLVAGSAGTAAMTAAQTLYYRQTGTEPSTTPAEVAKRMIRCVLQREVGDDETDLLNNAMHWTYGTAWGAVLGILAGSGRLRAVPAGIAFGLTVAAAGAAELSAMRLAPPMWEWDPRTLATDLGFHVVYGVTTAAAFRAINPTS